MNARRRIITNTRFCKLRYAPVLFVEKVLFRGYFLIEVFMHVLVSPLSVRTLWSEFRRHIRPVLTAAALAVLSSNSSHALTQVVLASPQGVVTGTIFTDAQGNLMYKVESGGKELILPSRIGVTRDAVDLGSSAKLVAVQRTSLNEQYPMVGVKTVGHNHAEIAQISIVSGGVGYTLEARAFDDGFAWRIVVPGTGKHHIQGEASSWTLPEGSRVWYAERNNDWKLKSYAGEWFSTSIDKLPVVSSQGPIQTPPLVVEPPAGGYLVITEAALANYSGMRLRAVGGRRVQANFFEEDSGFDVDGTVTTPWRVTFVDKDLNALVNTDILQNLNPPADPELFADTTYIRPGRSVWRFWTRDTGSPAQEMAFVNYAAQLGFEYTLVDAGWDDWPNRWQGMADLCAYAKARHVGVFTWRNYKYISNPANNWEELREFLDNAKTAGLAGVKIDFINGESKERVDFERTALLFAAQRHLMVDFHGIQKPTGEVRTFPNAISREGIRGLELNRMPEGPIPPSHNAALPFTRYAVGYGDYTPLGYTWPGQTTWAHQLATVVAFTSPFMTIAEDPEVLLNNPATRPGLDVLKVIPATWDETVVLPGSSIGTLAMIARRTGRTWFLSVLNGKDVPVELKAFDLSFLGGGHYNAVIITSPERRSLARQVDKDFTANSTLTAHLSGGDGLLVWFRATDAPK
jgi:alpha-glucosidase